MLLREWIALLIVLLCLILYGNVVESSEAYTWVYGGYAYNAQEDTDYYLEEMGENLGVVEVGYTYCPSLYQSRHGKLCVKTYYQHVSGLERKDKGINSSNLGLEYQHRWW